jgi:hypothetical protein
VRAWAMVNPYCGACARTRAEPSSVVEQVASSGTPLEARVCTSQATRSWNLCWRETQRDETVHVEEILHGKSDKISQTCLLLKS